jgi:hypothetical protein
LQFSREARSDHQPRDPIHCFDLIWGVIDHRHREVRPVDQKLASFVAKTKSGPRD